MSDGIRGLWSLRWKALAKKLRRTVQNWEETHLEEVGNLTVERDNLQFRLSLVTQDPESLASQLLSKHNALRMASENLTAVTAEREEALAARERLDQDWKHRRFAWLEQQAREVEAHAETRKALETCEQALLDTAASERDARAELAKAEARVKEAQSRSPGSAFTAEEKDILDAAKALSCKPVRLIVDDREDSEDRGASVPAPTGMMTLGGRGEIRKVCEAVIRWRAAVERGHAPAQPAAPTPVRGQRFLDRVAATAPLEVTVMASSKYPQVSCPRCDYVGDTWEHPCKEQPAAPMPEREYTWDGYALPMMTAAPEPSADYACADMQGPVMTDRQAAVMWMKRTESLEAQLAAVTGQYTAEDVVIILRAWRTLSEDAREAAWEAALLTPAPSHGAGEKT